MLLFPFFYIQGNGPLIISKYSVHLNICVCNEKKHNTCYLIKKYNILWDCRRSKNIHTWLIPQLTGSLSNQSESKSPLSGLLSKTVTVLEESFWIYCGEIVTIYCYFSFENHKGNFSSLKDKRKHCNADNIKCFRNIKREQWKDFYNVDSRCKMTSDKFYR